MTGSILIVDDESNMRELCSDILSEEGHKTQKAQSAKEALDALAQNQYQIVLSDIQMPEMDGVALLKEIRKLYPEVEVILMTAYAGLPSAIEAVRYGAYDYLSKPLSRDGLINSVRRCLEKTELNRKLKKSQAKLAEQEKLAAVGAVSAWLSHKMRNSLSVILMCAHYLKEKTAPTASEDTKEVIAAVLEKGKMLEHITGDLITYSRRYDLQKAPDNINVILEDAIKSLQTQIQLQGLTVVRQLAPSVPEISVDSQMVNEVFENILMNVLQAVANMENQTVTVKTEVLTGYIPIVAQDNSKAVKKQLSKPVDAVAVSITNTGSVILEENLSKIFAPFFTTKDSGSGLGLAIAKKVVDEHGGEIFAECTDGEQKTTTIKILFPNLP